MSGPEDQILGVLTEGILEIPHPIVFFCWWPISSALNALLSFVSNDIFLSLSSFVSNDIFLREAYPNPTS